MSTDTNLWGSRFTDGPSKEMARLSRSEAPEFALVPYDIEGQRSHIRALQRAGLVTEGERDEIVSALQQMQADFLNGKLVPSPEDEDPHTFLERVLIERLGPLGGKIRAGRSRNDQSANNTRLYMRDHARTVALHVVGLIDALSEQAERYLHTPAPGFTHLQSAQPVTFGHQLLAHAQPLYRSLTRLQDWDRRASVTMLGSAALAGSAIATDPEVSALDMGYEDSVENSIDGVGSRDVSMEFVYICGSLMVDVSRLSEELILWASQQFGWIKMDDRYSTGSSIMPQKKNPDIAELTRGKAGRLIGDVAGFMSVMKGLPLALNRDMQEDKRIIADAVETIDVVFPALAGMVRTLQANDDKMLSDASRGFTLATEVADWLARRGVPFAEAHEISGAVVKACEDLGFDQLSELSDEQLQAVDSRLSVDIRPHLTVDAALAARTGKGGTAPARVIEQLERLRKNVEAIRVWSGTYSGPRFPLPVR
ncbi:argininosuccinate lyase [Pseudarthrobacter sp. AG30]|uniref:argininosuccinate lyase n=1 Tax=Pseudarthrobacter sp. AG30 TaxID=2249742 RepID=UPI000D6E77FF|nr:argininosuccinate lyase [Pseudarthrobacter sp. AG30]RAX14926.1 argininosuccinate lyase [Pseudarthrobacter sp. AG30]